MRDRDVGDPAVVPASALDMPELPRASTPTGKLTGVELPTVVANGWTGRTGTGGTRRIENRLGLKRLGYAGVPGLPVSGAGVYSNFKGACVLGGVV